MKRIAWISLGFLLILSVNLQAADNVLPLEIKSLIGTKLSPAKGSLVPGWNPSGSYSLAAGKEELGVFLHDKGNVTIFMTVLLDKTDMSRTILDARELPQDFFAFKIIDGKAVPKRKDAYTNPNYYHFQALCKSDEFETVVGIARPVPGEIRGWSEHVKRAWAIDQETGHITKISLKDVSCFIETGGE